MSDVILTFDRDRILKYRWVDIRELCSRLGGLSLTQLLAKISEADPTAIAGRQSVRQHDR